MSKRMICLGGIHGVGKSTFCNEVIENGTLKYLSASEIIKNFNYDLPKTKNVFNIASNQEALIKGLEKVTDNRIYILDSHFTLLNEVGNVEGISTSFFEQIDPIAIVILYDTPASIRERLIKRDDKEYDLDFIKVFQDKELAHAEIVAKLLKIKFLRIDFSIDNKKDVFDEFVRSLSIK
jgi:adenylate kinase